MTKALLSLNDHLTPLLKGIRPVEPTIVRWSEAVGLRAVETVTAPRAFPASTMALRTGHAVSALDLAGASPQSPVPLATTPPLVTGGEPLPAGCDAILDPAALHNGRFGAEALDAVEPGAWVRLQGQDLAEGDVLIAAGSEITLEIALAATVVGRDEVAVRRPRIGLIYPAGPERDWLKARLAAAGGCIARDGERPDLTLRVLGDDSQKLALAPGGAAWAHMAEDGTVVDLPPRFDALLGAWCALVLPVLAQLVGAELRTTSLPLTRKIASAVGLSEIALLQLRDGEAYPLAVGDAPLGSIARTDAFAILDPGSEGFPAGEQIPAILLDRPFRHARSAG